MLMLMPNPLQRQAELFRSAPVEMLSMPEMNVDGKTCCRGD